MGVFLFFENMHFFHDEVSFLQIFVAIEEREMFLSSCWGSQVGGLCPSVVREKNCCAQISWKTFRFSL